jgi:hypothetical protein
MLLHRYETSMATKLVCRGRRVWQKGFLSGFPATREMVTQPWWMNGCRGVVCQGDDMCRGGIYGVVVYGWLLGRRVAGGQPQFN